MPLVIHGPKPGSIVTHTPTVFDNNLSDKPTRVLLIAPSNGDRRELATHPENPVEVMLDDEGRPARDADGNHKFRIRADRQRAWRDRLLRRFVKAIEGYVFDDGSAVATVDDLLAFGQDEVIGDIYLAVQGLLYLSGDAAKPSAGPSDSSPQAIRLSSGTAADVEQAAHAGSATADLNGRTQDSSMSPPAG